METYANNKRRHADLQAGKILCLRYCHKRMSILLQALLNIALSLLLSQCFTLDCVLFFTCDSPVCVTLYLEIQLLQIPLDVLHYLVSLLVKQSCLFVTADD